MHPPPGLVAHDFFTEQPVKNPTIYLLRLILHDWADEKAEIILKALRKSAGPNTQLIFLEQIVPYACADTGISDTIPGAAQAVPPPPLMPNMGIMGHTSYLGDLIVRAFFAACIRALNFGFR